MNITIIIPTYNVENTIAKTIDYLENQTYQNFEIVCVDDCSEDRTSDILLELKNKDNRISIFKNKKRMGAAYSRNYGLENAIGEYVIFLDADDYFYPTMLEQAYNLAKKNDLDMCLFDYEIIDVKTDEVIHESGIGCRVYAEKYFNYSNIDNNDYREIVLAPWNKLLRREFLLREKIVFQSITNSNDFRFSMLSYLLASRIQAVKSEKPLIVQLHHGGKERISNNRNPINEFLVFKGMLKEAKRRNFDEKQIDLIFLKSVDAIMRQFLNGEGDGIYYSFLKSEGIDELYNIGGAVFRRISKYYNNPLDNIIKKEFDSDWFKNYNGCWLPLIDSRNKIWDYWRLKKKIAVWGAGFFGKIFMSILKDKSLSTDFWFDSYEEKSFSIDENEYTPVKPTKEKIVLCDVIIIAIKNVPSSIYETITECKQNIVIEKLVL